MKSKAPKAQKSAKLSKRAVSSPGTAIQKRIPELPDRIETLLMQGDLTGLSVPERLTFYKSLCRSLGLNPLTRPFEYIVFTDRDQDDETQGQAKGKMMLYARADCAAQLRKIYHVGTTVTSRQRNGEFFEVVAETYIHHPEGKRTDSSIGVVWLKKWKSKNGQSSLVDLSGRELANAMMKAETKAKRRATFSICGLHILDETELEDLTSVHYEVTESGRVVEVLPAADPALERYEQREREQIAKLTPEQQEVLQSKMAKAKKVSPDQRPVETAAAAGPSAETPGAAAAADYDGLTCGPFANEHYHIEGPDALKRQHRELLKPLWKPLFSPPGIYATADEFGKLCRRFEEAKIKYRIL